MADIVIPWALVRQRRNPARIAHRNLRLVQGEDIDLALTCWNLDTDPAPLDLSQSVVTLGLFCDRFGAPTGPWIWDYGFVRDADYLPVVQVVGRATPGGAGSVTIALTAAITAPLGGRYSYIVQANSPSAIGDFSASDFDYEFAGGAGAAVTFTQQLLSPTDGAPLLGADGTPLYGYSIGGLARPAGFVGCVGVLGIGILDVIGCPWGGSQLLVAGQAPPIDSNITVLQLLSPVDGAPLEGADGIHLLGYIGT